MTTYLADLLITDKMSGLPNYSSALPSFLHCFLKGFNHTSLIFLVVYLV